MTETLTVPEVLGTGSGAETFAARTAKFADVLEGMARGVKHLDPGVPVVITSVSNDTASDLLHRKATLKRIDLVDDRLTFWVEDIEDGHGVNWVHDVERTDVPSPSEPGIDPELAEARAQIERLQTRLQEQRNETRSVREMHEAFRIQVREVAIREVPRHWCKAGCNEILEELGLDPMTEPRYSFVVVQRTTVVGRPSQEDPSQDWTESSIRSVGDGTVEMDGDWEDVEVLENEVTVEDVSEYEDD